MSKTNAWVCKDCFNYRVEFNLADMNMQWWWTNQDFLYLSFDQPVSFVTTAHPIQDVVAADSTYSTYKLSFKPDFFPGDNRIDFNIEFREANLTSHVTSGIMCPWCYPAPIFVEEFTPEEIHENFLAMRDIDITAEKKTHINYERYKNRMNKVNKYFNLAGSVDEIISPDFECAQPFDSEKYMTDSYAQWLNTNEALMETLRLSPEVEDTCKLIELIEQGVDEMARSYVCLDAMKDRFQRRFQYKIEKISWSKGPKCHGIKL